MKRNVTLSLDEELLADVRILAATERKSISALMAEALAARLEAANGYEAARASALRIMKEGLDLGTGGRATWTRDELHER